MLRLLGRSDRRQTEQAVKKTRQSWLSRVTTLIQSPRLDDSVWDDLEELLVTADVGLATTERLIDAARERQREGNLTSPADVVSALKDEMVNLLLSSQGDKSPLAIETPPLVLLMAGVNGVGKTTSIAKLTRLFRDEGRRVVLGAADTFRAAAIDQLQIWGQRLDVEVIAHQPGGDPGAVAFDTLQAAKSRGADVVIIDTAGRLHNKRNLMEEMRKIRRVLSRQGGHTQRAVLTLDATTGQNGLIQARAFTEALECDGVFLAKLDGTAKGGIVFAIAADLCLPVLYIGTGEGQGDITPFDARDFVEALFEPLEV